MHKLLLPTLLLFSLTANAQIYRTTDEHGNVVFTDTPAAGAQGERVEIRDTNTTPAPTTMPTAESTAQPPAAEPEAISYSITITSPTNETSFPMGPGNFSVDARVTPALRGGESLQLLLDGAPRGEAQRTPSWALTNVFRGAHDLTVAVVDSQGEVLASSESVRVFVHRPSVNFRNRN